MTNKERAKAAVTEWAKKFFITFDDPLTGPGLADIIEKSFRELLEEREGPLDAQREKADRNSGLDGINDALVYIGDCLRELRR